MPLLILIVSIMGLLSAFHPIHAAETSLSFQQALDAALSRHPGLKALELEDEALKAEEVSKRLFFLPGLAVQWFQSEPSDGSPQLRWTAQIESHNHVKGYFDLAIMESAREQQSLRLQEKTFAIKNKVLVAYLAALLSQGYLTQLERAHVKVMENLDFLLEQKSKGLASEADILRFEMTALRLSNRLEGARERQRMHLESLLFFCGLPLGTRPGLTSKTRPLWLEQASLRLLDTQELTSLQQQQRAKELEMANLFAKQKNSEYWPQIFLQYDVYKEEYLDSRASKRWTYGLKWDFTLGSRAYWEAKAAKLRVERSGVELRWSGLSEGFEAQEALFYLKSLAGRFSNFEKIWLKKAEVFVYIQEQFRAGLVSSQVVNTAYLESLESLEALEESRVLENEILQTLELLSNYDLSPVFSLIFSE